MSFSERVREAASEKIIDLYRGTEIPDGWTFVQHLYTKDDLIGTRDTLLVRRAALSDSKEKE